MGYININTSGNSCYKFIHEHGKIFYQLINSPVVILVINFNFKTLHKGT